VKVLVAQIGARRHYAVPRALHLFCALERVVTDACASIPPWTWVKALVPASMITSGVRGLLGRSVDGVPRERIRGLPWFAVAGALGRRGDSSTVHWARRNAAFCRAAAKLGFNGADTVYAFNGAALELFREARSRGLRTVLDQTAAPWRWNSELLREETRSWPGWESSPAEIDELGRMTEREEAEWELADRIVCGSGFILDAISACGGPVDRCVVVRYPTPELETEGGNGFDGHLREGPLRVLFVGSLQLRKGIQYLWRVKQELEDTISVRVVGPSLLSASAQAKLAGCMDLRGARPRSEIPEHLAWADVLVLPTLSEGAANVCFEAQGAGVPVLTTFSAGSGIEHETDGWLVAARDVESMVTILRDGKAVREMRRALASSPERIRRRGLEEYGRDLVAAMDSGATSVPMHDARRN